MIEVVTPENYGQYAAELTEMYRLRCRVFRDRLKWDVDVRDGLEVDQFDNLAPTYLLAMDEARNIVGTWRLLPTTGPYMLRDVFPQLLEGDEPPSAPGVWETSRFAVDCPVNDECGLSAINRITNELFCGLVELGIGNGIHEVVTVYDIRIARLLNRVGCRPFWRSKRQRIGNTIAVAGRFEISSRVLGELRTKGGIHESVLRGSAPYKLPTAA